MPKNLLSGSFLARGRENIDVLLPGGGSIPVSDQYRYLGVNCHASAVLFGKHEEHVQQASMRATNVLQRRSLWGCNKFVTRNLT